MNPWKCGSYYKDNSKNVSIGKERNVTKLNNALIIGDQRSRYLGLVKLINF